MGTGKPCIRKREWQAGVQPQICPLKADVFIDTLPYNADMTASLRALSHRQSGDRQTAVGGLEGLEIEHCASRRSQRLCCYRMSSYESSTSRRATSFGSKRP